MPLIGIDGDLIQDGSVGIIDLKSEVFDDIDLRISGEIAKISGEIGHIFPNWEELDKVTDGDHDVRTDNPHAVKAIQISDFVTEVQDAISGEVAIAFHDSIDSLVHNINESCFEEIIRESGRVTDIIYWTNSGKTMRIRDVHIVRTNNKVTQVVTRQYDNSGTIIQTFTQDITRSGLGTLASITGSKS